MKRRTSHAVMRARRRFGKRGKSAVDLVLALKAAVKDGTAKLRRRYPDGQRSRWEAFVQGRRVRFIFDQVSGMVVTVLPSREMRVRGGEQLQEREEAAPVPESEVAGDLGVEPT